MKKLAYLMAALMIMVAAAGSAQAGFTNNDLVLTVYNAAGNEVGIDLGINLLTYNFATAINDKVIDHTTDATWTLADIGAGFTLGDVNAAVYGRTDAVGGMVNFYMAMTKDFNPAGTTNAGSWATVTSNTNKITNTYGVNDPDGKKVVSATANDTYFKLMDNAQATTAGNFANFNTNNMAFGEAAMEDDDPYFDMYLYRFYVKFPPNSYKFVPFAADQPYQAEVRLFANGDVVINPNPVPVPAAVWLLGSGLIGLVGIRRRNA